VKHAEVLPGEGSGAPVDAVRSAVRSWFKGPAIESSTLVRDRILERERARCEVRDAERLAHEVRQGLLQELAAIAYYVAATRHEGQRQGAALGDRLDRISDLLVEAMRHCRSAVEGQALFLTHQCGLIPSLQHLVEVANTHDGPRFELIVEPAPLDTLTASDTHELFRIAEAAIANAGMQSANTQVVVRVRCDDDQLTLEVEDDGDYFLSADRSIVDTAMALADYRARSMGGRLEYLEGRTAGLVVRCQVPVRQWHDLTAGPTAAFDSVDAARYPNRGADIVADGPYCATG
jgi:two-component system nitrate/nitrite sensor histidine kinase NarX